MRGDLFKRRESGLINKQKEQNKGEKQSLLMQRKIKYYAERKSNIVPYMAEQ